MFFSRKAEGKLVAIIEIQSSVARTSLAWYRPGMHAHILFIDERPIPYKPNVGSAYFVKTTMKALSESVDAALRRFRILAKDKQRAGLPKHIAETHYVLSSPWIASQARTLSLSFDKTTAITDDKVKEILAAERSKLSPKDSGPLETIEEKIFEIRLNGYAVSEWHGRQAKELEISYAVTVGGTDTVRRLRDAAEKIAGSSNIRFHSSLLLQYIGMRVSMPEKDSYALIHIHGELTDVVIVKHGSCIFFGSYPMGIGTIVRKIAHATKTDGQTADSLLSLFLGGRLDEAAAKDAGPVMQDMMSGWSGEFGKLFRDASADLASVRDAFIISRIHEELFLRSFKAAHPKAHVEAVGTSEAAPGITFEPSVGVVRGVSVYAAALSVI